MSGGRFAGRAAVVTGGASGIGAATARRLAGEGAAVLIADIQDELGEQAAAAIEADGGAARYRRCDVSSHQDWEGAVEEAVERWGRLDFVHNNAYADAVAPTHELDEQDWQRVLDVCLKQVFLSAKACMRHLVAAKGAMVSTSSVQALIGNAQYAAYEAAKGGILSLTRTLAVEYGPAVRVNAVLPGAILTPAWDPYPPEAQERAAEQCCLKRMAAPEEVASVVCFLLSDDAAYVTGQGIVVDGGWTITRS